MPLLRKEKFQKVCHIRTFKDEDEVFYCEITKEIFANYE